MARYVSLYLTGPREALFLMILEIEELLSLLDFWISESG